MPDKRKTQRRAGRWVQITHQFATGKSFENGCISFNASRLESLVANDNYLVVITNGILIPNAGQTGSGLRVESVEYFDVTLTGNDAHCSFWAGYDLTIAFAAAIDLAVEYHAPILNRTMRLSDGGGGAS